MMKGLDTNVIARYLVMDDIKQAEIAASYIKGIVAAGKSCFINRIVLCELVWVLESAYGYSRNDIAGVLDQIVMTRQFEIDSRDIVRLVIEDYRSGKGDISDYLVGRINQIEGCDVTATFDRALKNSSGFALLD